METTTTSSYQTTPQTQPNIWAVGAKGGLVTGIILFLFTFIFQYLLGIFVNWWLMAIPFLGGIIGIVMTHKTYKNEGNGFMSYGKGLIIAVALGAVAGFVMGLLSFIYINLVDPTIPEKQADAAAELQISMLERFDAGDAEIDKAYDQAEAQKEDAIAAAGNPLKTIGYPIFGWTVFSLILGLVVSAFTKNTDPTVEY